MKKIALIPARLSSTRFPRKLLQDLGGEAVIVQTYRSVCATRLFDEVVVVCEDDEIAQEVRRAGGVVLLSGRSFPSGTDRIAAALLKFPEAEIVVNVQGDEPFVPKKALSEMVRLLEADPSLPVASLMHPFFDDRGVDDPNQVKVVVNRNSEAIYFSRSRIPYRRNPEERLVYYKHIGIYGFRREGLLQFAEWMPSTLERVEQLECLRYLENGLRVKMIVTNEVGVGIDTPEDLERARLFFHQQSPDSGLLH